MHNQSNINSVRTILLRDWDPFCVGDNPNLSGEYDGFIADILSHIERGITVDRIGSYLLDIEKKLHATISDTQRNKVAALLLQVK